MGYDGKPSNYTYFIPISRCEKELHISSTHHKQEPSPRRENHGSKKRKEKKKKNPSSVNTRQISFFIPPSLCPLPHHQFVDVHLEFLSKRRQIQRNTSPSPTRFPNLLSFPNAVAHRLPSSESFWIQNHPLEFPRRDIV